MKNKIFSTFLFSFFALLIFNSCKKENIDVTETSTEEIIPDTIICNLTAEIILVSEQDPAILGAMTSGETGSLNYLWSEGSSTAQISPLQDSLYSVTITDELGCTTESSFDYISIIDCSSLDVDITYIDSIPALRANTSLGTPPLLYIWSEGSTTQEIIITPPGTFSVTVTDSLGCTGEDEITL